MALIRRAAAPMLSMLALAAAIGPALAYSRAQNAALAFLRATPQPRG